MSNHLKVLSFSREMHSSMPADIPVLAKMNNTHFFNEDLNDGGILDRVSEDCSHEVEREEVESISCVKTNISSVLEVSARLSSSQKRPIFNVIAHESGIVD